MNIRELKRRLLPFQGFRNDDDGDGSDLGGELISTIDGAPGPDEDRGDDFTPTSGPDAAPVAPTPAAAPEPAADPEEGEGGAASPRGGMIPHARFNEVNAARKAAQERADALERELAALRQQQSSAAPAPAPAAAPAAPEFNEAEREKDYANALMDGDVDKAAQIRAEINRHLRNQAALDAREQQRREAQQQREAVEAEELSAASAKAIQDFPYLNTPDGEEALELIVAARNRRVAQGMPIAQALTEAVAAIAPKFAPAGAATPSRELPGNNPKQDTRTTQAIQRGAQATIAQPPAIQAGVGNRATAVMVDPATMTDEQFNALSEADKARLRGDSI